MIGVSDNVSCFVKDEDGGGRSDLAWRCGVVEVQISVLVGS